MDGYSRQRMRPSKESIDTNSKSGVSPTRSYRTLSATSSCQRHLDDYTRKLEMERRKYNQEQKNHSTVLQQLEAERMLLHKLQVSHEEINVKSVPLKRRYQEHYSKSFASNDNIKAQVVVLRQEIIAQRKDANKFKDMSSTLNEDITDLEQQHINLQDRICSIREANEQIKQQIMKQRGRNREDATNFKLGMMAISTTYFSEKKQHQQQPAPQVYELETNALPALKRRLGNLICHNQEKQGVISQYRKVSEDLRRMFEDICSYTAKEDITHIVEEFVNKEKIIFKLEQQVSTTENNLIVSATNSAHISTTLTDRNSHKDIQVTALQQDINTLDRRIAEEQTQRQGIVTLLGKTLLQLSNSGMVTSNPIHQEEELNSTNKEFVIQLVGEVEEYLNVVRPVSPQKVTLGEGRGDEEDDKNEERRVDLQTMPEVESTRQELLRYEDLLQIANDALTRFKETPKDRKSPN